MQTQLLINLFLMYNSFVIEVIHGLFTFKIRNYHLIRKCRELYYHLIYYMCLILFAYNQHPKYKLVLAANRDEFFNRPTLVADYWTDDQNILGGRDIVSSGTWLGMTKTGKFIAITNYRDPKLESKDLLSRGLLSRNYLTNDQRADSFLLEVSESKDQYAGFNLLLSDDKFNSFFHYSNMPDTRTQIETGVHGLSNHLLNTPWPKVSKGKESLSTLLKRPSFKLDDLLNLLKNDTLAPDSDLPDTGISYDLEKKLSPVFISMKGYGTRSSTVILMDYNGDIMFHEVSYNENREIANIAQYQLHID